MRHKKILLFLILALLIALSGCTDILTLQKENRELKAWVEALQAETDNLYQLFEDISLEVVPANVMIYTYCYKTAFGIIYDEVGGQGRGVIISSDSENYYVLTNNHVISSKPGYPRVEHEIYDYKMNKTRGYVVFSDPNYDLAVVRFRKSIELAILPLANKNPVKGDRVVAIGQPEGQLNVITFGKVINYILPNCSDCNPSESSVNFPCILHDSFTNHGNSGGMLINHQKEIVGINTFGSTDTSYGLAVPIEKIQAFLAEHDFLFNNERID